MRAAAHGAVPFLLLSERRRAYIHDVLESCISSWLRQWSTQSVRASIQISEGLVSGPHKEAGRPVSHRLRVLHPESDALLQADVSTSLLPALIGVSAGISSRNGDVASALNNDVIKDLCDRILQRVQVRGVTFETLPIELGQDGIIDPRWLRIEMAIGTERSAVTLELSPYLTQLLRPLGEDLRASGPMSDMRAAIGSETVRVEAWLANASVTLADLARLTEGDVILLDQPLDQPCLLVAGEGRQVAKASLGRVGANRAVSVTV